MKALPLFAALTVALLLAGPIAAESCEPSMTEPELAVAVAYVDFGFCQPSTGCPPFDHWIYVESNGIDGLQRRDASRDDTCGGRIEPDTLIF